MNKAIIACVCLLFSVHVMGKISLPGIFSDGMVLQQQTVVWLWGTTDQKAAVTVNPSWSAKTYRATPGNDGSWRMQISTPEAGGPYTIRLSDGEKMVLGNVLIGEVWLCSGQSNMEMAMRGNSSPILNSGEIITWADNPRLRLYTVSRATSVRPLSALKNGWKESTPETARDFSALAFQYGQILQKRLSVPVGIIVSSVGGTMIEAWMSNSSLQPYSEVKIPPSLDTFTNPHREPTALFNGMIAPLVGYGIKGFVWYQGESNRHEPVLYERLFPAMVADWRARWGYGELPFYYVQIAPYGASDPGRSGPRLREAQLHAAATIPGAGMVSAIDVGMENDIHPMNKTVLAQRLSYWALGVTYGIKGIGYQAPVYSSLKIDGNKAIVSFDHAPYLTSYHKPLTLFEVAGEDKVFHPAKAEINRNTVTVQSDQVAKPVAVRYAYKEWVVGELYNNDNLPASSFRTDDW